MAELFLKSINIDEQINIITNEFPDGLPNPFRVLDIGCGGGSLIFSLHTALKKKYPKKTIEVFGFDVFEHSGGRKEYLNSIINNLKSTDKNVDWKNRVFVISENDKLPFNNGFFDCLLSNQVVEHIKNHDLFFSENRRVLKNNGIGIHIYSSKENWRDGHLKLFFVHKFLDFDIIKSYIRFLSRIGIGKYKGKYKKEKIKEGFTLEDYVKYQAEYMVYQVNYISMKEALKLCKKNNLRATFVRYNISKLINRIKKFLLIKIIFKLFKIENKSFYFQNKNFILNIIEKIILFYFSRIGSVTLIVEKRKLKRYGVFVK